MSKDTYKTLLWLYSDDKDTGSTNQDCTFFLKKPIENIISFKMKNLQIEDVEGIAVKIGSNSLSSLTSDRIVTSSDASNIVFDFDLTYGTSDGITYTCQKSKLDRVDIKVYDESGSTLSVLGSDVWAMAIEFECQQY
jgi:hypothetical protein